MTSQIIPLSFVRLNLEKSEKEWKKLKKVEYLENKNNFLDYIKSIFQFLEGYHLVEKIKNSGHKL